MVTEGAGKNEATIAESRLRSGKKKMVKKIPPLHHSALFARRFCFNLITLSFVFIYYLFALLSLQFNPLDRHYNNIAIFLFWPADRNFYLESSICDYDIEDEFNESLVDNVRNLNYYFFFYILTYVALPVILIDCLYS